MKTLFCLPLAIGLLAQTPQPPAPVRSPEVSAERTVTFRLRAPNAQKVELSLEGSPRQAMTKGEDGVWTLTTAPLSPDLYGYSFVVDGVGFVDPANGKIKTNALSVNSAVLVPGGMPWEQSNVPHGTVHHHFYESKLIGDKRDFFVYTPPGYDASKKYPLLVLLHGFSDYADGWTTVGKANLIFDNLIAKNEIKPMVVVMPLGYGVPIDMLYTGMQRGPGTPWQKNAENFGKALLEEVLPAAEKTYSLSSDRKQRAITGLSMGGGEALLVGLNNLDKFAYVGAFSAGGGGNSPADLYPKLSGGDNSRMKLWMACGTEDRLIENNRKLVEWLKSKNVKHTWVETPGAHTWLVWRRYLSDFSKQLDW